MFPRLQLFETTGDVVSYMWLPRICPRLQMKIVRVCVHVRRVCVCVCLRVKWYQITVLIERDQFAPSLPLQTRIWDQWLSHWGKLWLTCSVVLKRSAKIFSSCKGRSCWVLTKLLQVTIACCVSSFSQSLFYILQIFTTCDFGLICPFRCTLTWRLEKKKLEESSSECLGKLSPKQLTTLCPWQKERWGRCVAEGERSIIMFDFTIQYNTAINQHFKCVPGVISWFSHVGSFSTERIWL